MTLAVTAIVTFVVTYIIFVKKNFTSVPQDTNDKQPTAKSNTIIYEEPVGPSSHTSNKANVQLQPNPAYGTSDKVIMDTNPAYESCK